MHSDSAINVEAPESRWFVWGRSAFAVAVATVLIALGVANVATYSRWHEYEDGVQWGARAEGVTAIEISDGSAASIAGIKVGDVLLAVDGSPVQTPADVVEHQHRSHQGTKLEYALVRFGTSQALQISLTPTPRGSSIYYILAAVGLFTLLVGAFVRVRRPRDQATLHFFWLCVAFFGVFTFSFSGQFDRLDWVFYWGDAVAFALLPPLLLHFTMVFPEREADDRRTNNYERIESIVIPLMYLPALVLGAARVIAIVRGSDGSLSGPLFSRILDVLDRAEPAYLFVCAVAALAVLARAFRDITSVTARRQLRWIAWRDRAWRRSVCVRLRPALGTRHEPADGAPVDGHPARSRPADVRRGDRPLPTSRRRGDHQARPGLHGVPRGERRALCGAAQAHRVRLRE